MTHARLIIFVGCCAVWATAPVELAAQSVTSAANSMQVWRRTSQGLSPNAALARYQMQSLGHRNQRPLSLRHSSGWPGTTLYSTPYYAVTTNRTIPARPINYYPTTNFSATSVPQTQKPFADLRRQPNAVQRYWPYMMEAREDPRTGLIIWQLP